MKRLLHIAAHLGGGAGKAISGLIKNISGYENTVVLLEEPQDSRYCDACRQTGAGIIIAPSSDEIVRLAREYDAVIFNWWAHPLTVDLIKKLGEAETRLILWSHINGLQYPVLTPDLICSFDGCMLTSPCTLKNKRFTDEERDRAAEKCSYVYGTGDFRPETFPHKDSYETDDTIVIGYIGTLDNAKINPGFPKICSGIKKHIHNAKFVLCGKYSAEFRENFFADHPELEDCTEFTGFVREPEKILPTFDIFCYPLACENYATTENALLEAMAAGLPVVVLDNPAEREIVENEMTGIVADGIDSFTEKTVGLCGDEEYRRKLGISARNAVIRKYDASVNAGCFTDAVENVLKTEKKKHDLSSVIGRGIWDSFLYFCGDDRQKILDVMKGKNVKLPAIYYSESKSSPAQYMKYFDDENIKMLAERISQNVRMEK
ncbi:MAG: glycosyltransferase family 4 protein [Ruminiclostridium sp.]|nr:glycosyltransferase family 4 protein [Ruminiclostridium sp.]